MLCAGGVVLLLLIVMSGYAIIRTSVPPWYGFLPFFGTCQPVVYRHYCALATFANLSCVWNIEVLSYLCAIGQR